MLGVRTGIGRYARELAEALELQGVGLRPYAVALRGGSDRSIARWRLPARLVQYAWRRFEAPSIHRLVGEVDVIHATHFVLPALGSTPGVVTVPDLSFERKDSLAGGDRLRTLVPWSVGRAARVLAPSKAVADEIGDRYGPAPECVVVTHEGVSPTFFGATPLADSVLASMGITRPFAVAVGTLEPRKNLARLLEAWALAADELDTWTLVLAGPGGWGPSLPRTPGVVLTGWVSDETLPGLLAASEFFCYPSLYEGFGLPPLEAMASGTPALVGRYPAAEELLGDAALLVDPGDPEAIAGGLVRLASDASLRRTLTVTGRAQASSFTWEATALATIAAYREALQEG